MPPPVHPSELAYALSYAGAQHVIGWDITAFLPPDEAQAAQWLTDGETRLCAAGRLVGTQAAGLNFTDDMAATVLALADPTVVLLAERKAGAGVRKLSVHVSGADFVGLARQQDGQFALTRYADLTAAAGACAGFVGASIDPPQLSDRIETSQEDLTGAMDAALDGRLEDAAAKLVEEGALHSGAKAALGVLTRPTAAGVVSVFYCADNTVKDGDAYTVVTGADDQTWVMFAPTGPAGPLILELSSVSGLAARIAVDIAARFARPE